MLRPLLRSARALAFALSAALSLAALCASLAPLPAAAAETPEEASARRTLEAAEATLRDDSFSRRWSAAGALDSVETAALLCTIA